MDPAVVTRFAPSPTGDLHPGMPGRRSFPSCSRGAWADDSCFASRTRTGSADATNPSQPRSRTSPGSTCPGMRARARRRARSLSPVGARPLCRILRAARARGPWLIPCFCTPAELDVARSSSWRPGEAPRYLGTCRRLGAAVRAERIKAGRLGRAALCDPGPQTIQFDDIVRGPQSVEAASLGDFVVRRADGGAVFFFCNAVDDALMGITHVLRGDDHLSNTPRPAAGAAGARPAGAALRPPAAPARRGRRAAVEAPRQRHDRRAPQSRLPGRQQSATTCCARPPRRAGRVDRAGGIPATHFHADKLGRAPAHFDRGAARSLAARGGAAARCRGDCRLAGGRVSGRLARPRSGSRLAALLRGNLLLPGDARALVRGPRRLIAALGGRRSEARSWRRARPSSTRRSRTYSETGANLRRARRAPEDPAPGARARRSTCRCGSR